MKDYSSRDKRVRSDQDFNIFYPNYIEERLKKMREKLEKQGFETAPTEIQRNQETLSAIFKQYDLDIMANKEFFETLLDWKRTL